MGDEVGRDRVHADDNQRKRPASIELHVHDPGECGEKEEADSAAEERPAWRPDALDDGAEAGEVEKKAGCDKHGAGDDETLNGNFGSGRAEPFTGAQPEQHGAERGNEAEGEIAAVVVDE